MKEIIVFSGPSGAGKSTLIKMLLDEFPEIGETVSHTTRKARAGEQNGVDYHFVSVDAFKTMVDANQFVEYVECYGNYYGTSLFAISETLKKSDICIMDLEWQGAFNVLSHNLKLGDVEKLGVLILPPSIKTLRQRLDTRGSETPESLERRVNESFQIDQIARYDHVIVNNDLATAYEQLREVIREIRR